MKRGRNLHRFLALLLTLCLTIGLAYTAFAATSLPPGMYETDDPIEYGGDGSILVVAEDGSYIVITPDGTRRPAGQDVIDYYTGGSDEPTPEPDPVPVPPTDPPVTDAPPITDPPVTDPPVTDPPVTDPPVTDPPVTDPPAHQHTFVEETTPGTCMQRETVKRTCTECGYTETVEGNYGDHWWDYEHPVVIQEATVAQEGIREIHCHYNYDHMFQEKTPMLERTDTFAIVYKEWDDDDNAAGLRPESLTVTLLANGGSTGLSIVLNEENGWCGWIADLPKFDDEGKEIIYDWIEEEIPYYAEDDHFYEAIDFTTVIVNKIITHEDELIPPETYTPVPALTLTWLYDDPAKTLYDPDDYAHAQHVVKNTGDVVLKIRLRYETGYGSTGEYYKGTLWEGQEYKTYIGFDPLQDAITPNTETETLLGTATITFWYVGYDPVTGTQLCETEKVTRNWDVKKPGPSEWEIPDGSDMVVIQYEDSNSADPAGYQLGEYYRVYAETENISDEDIDPYDFYIPFSDMLLQKNTLNAHQSCTFVGYMEGYVTAADVTRGYIEFLPEEASWIDPVSMKQQYRYSEKLTLDVTSKTGLLLHKSVENEPANKKFFQEGETIKWKLTVYNNSLEPITDVTVIDQGKVVGTFPIINPGETMTCTVPDHTVTYPDVIAGYVINKAEATGKDAQGKEHTYPSNKAKALTGKEPDPTPPDPTPKKPGGGTEDPKGPIFGIIVSTSIVKTETSKPANGSYYTEGETIKYEITVKNTGEVTLENIKVTDSLGGLAPIGTIPKLAPDESKTFPFSWTVTADDVDKTYVINSAVLDYDLPGGYKGTPVPSNKVKSPTNKKIVTGDLDTPGIDKSKLPGKPVLKDKDGNPYLDKDGKPIVAKNGKPDCCELRLEELGDSELHYTLHACGTHSEAARKAEEAAAAGTAEAWKAAGDIWREEIDKIYEILYEAADSDAKTAVVNDRVLFYSYVDTYEAMQAAQDPVTVQKTITEMLRLRCTELCYMIHTVPDNMPYTLLQGYPAIPDSTFEATTRTIGALTGSDSKVVEQLSPEMALTQKTVVSTIRGAKKENTVNAFLQAQGSWQVMLDGVTNANYLAADKEGRKVIAACRVMLDKVVDARRTLLLILYSDNPAAAQEALANLYRDMAMDAAENQ